MAVRELNYDRLTRLSYQTAKDSIKKMELAQAEALFEELQVHIQHLYKQMVGYAPPKFVAVVKNEEGERVPTFRVSPIGPKDFNALMGGVKKLEILYGYFWDRLNGTDFSSVR